MFNKIKKNYFVWCVILPVLMFTLYNAFVAKERFVSSASVVIQNVGGGGAEGLGGLASLISGSSNSVGMDLLHIKEFIVSADMMDRVNQKFGLLDHWSNQGLDYLYALQGAQYKEKALEYYRSKVNTVIHTETGSLGVSVETFEPKLSKEVLDYLLLEAEAFVNENAHKAAREQVSFIEKNVEENKKELDALRATLVNYQKNKRVLSPQLEVEQKGRLLAQLEESRLKLEAEYESKKEYMDTNAPAMKVLRKNIDFTVQRIEQERRSLSGGGVNSVNTIFDEYKVLESELTLKFEALRVSLIGLEKAKIDAARKLKQLVFISSPMLPEYPLYPRVWWGAFYSFIILSILFGVVKLMSGVVLNRK